MLLKYRPEIDGLRAVAVVSVVLYHAGFILFGKELFAGGFIGVDIFFVISGYLITTIIVKQLMKGEFSFLRFYERRARRILPALFTVMLATIPFALAFMQTNALREYASSIIASLVFVSNILFWRQDSYIAEPSALKPFLHTWSLSVEEQFYILFPLLLLLVWRFAPRFLLALLLIAFAFSLQLSQYGSNYAANAAFFLLPTRGWELLAGAILAKIELDRGRDNPPLLERWMPLLGLLMLAASLALFHDKMRHPSYITLLPVVGTMLFIRFARTGELVTGLLASRPFVLVGLVSYSFYLWHYPLFAFGRITQGSLDDWQKLALIFASLLLAIATYFLIEQPVRRGAFVSKRSFVVATGTVMACLLLGNIFIFKKLAGIHVTGVAHNLFENLELEKTNCPPEKPCGAKTDSGLPAIVSMGDSHAFNFEPALDEMAKSLSRPFVSLSQLGCPLVLGTYIIRNGKPYDCNESVNHKRHKQLKNLPGSIIVYNARLPVYLSESFFDNQEGGHEDDIDKGTTHHLKLVSGKTGSRELGGAVIATFKKMIADGHLLVLVYPIPEVGWNVPETIRKKLVNLPSHERQKAFEDDRLSTSYDVYKKRTAQVRVLLDSLGSNERILRIYPDQVLCSKLTGRCYTHNRQALYYLDDDHLTRYGAAKIVQLIKNNLLQWERHNHQLVSTSGRKP